MTKVLNLANELQFKITKATNGFYVLTDEPSDSQEDTIVQKSYVIEAEEKGNFRDSGLADMIALRKLFWQLKEFFGMYSNHFYYEIKILEKESGKEVEIE